MSTDIFFDFFASLFLLWKLARPMRSWSLPPREGDSLGEKRSRERIDKLIEKDIAWKSSSEEMNGMGKMQMAADVTMGDVMKERKTLVKNTVNVEHLIAVGDYEGCLDVHHVDSYMEWCEGEQQAGVGHWYLLHYHFHSNCPTDLHASHPIEILYHCSRGCDT